MRAALPLLVFAAACGGEGEVEATGTGGGASGGGTGQGGEGGQAISFACPPGSGEADDGSCSPAGVDSCGEYFVADDAGGCDPILPARACADGQMAIPGETICRPVSDCGTDTFPSVPANVAVQYVDQGYAGMDSDGTEAKPWLTVTEAIGAVEPDGYVAVAAGTYGEYAHIEQKPVHLVGRCPDLVELGAGHPWGVVIGNVNDGGAASGSSVTSVAITSDEIGFITSGATNLLLDEVWIHHTDEFAVLAGDNWGPTTLEIRGSLIEDNVGLGVLVSSASLTLTDSVVRENDPLIPTGDGRGLGAENPTGGDHLLVVRRSLFDDNTTMGLGFFGVAGVVEDVVIRNTRTDDADQYGRGLVIQNHGMVAADVEVRRVVLADNHDAAMFVQGSTTTATDVVVRDTMFTSAGGTGVGVQAQYDPVTWVPAHLEMASSLVERSRQGGIGIISASGELDRVRVADTQPSQNGLLGVGVAVIYDANFLPDEVPPSSGVIRGSVIENNYVAGISAAGSSLQIEGVVVDRVLPRQTGEFGDGIVLLGGIAEASVRVENSRVEQATRAGAVNFGALFEVGTTTFECNGIDLDGEDFVELDFAFDDLGGNTCGCDGEEATCKVLSTNLTPPGTSF